MNYVERVRGSLVPLRVRVSRVQHLVAGGFPDTGTNRCDQDPEETADSSQSVPSDA